MGLVLLVLETIKGWPDLAHESDCTVVLYRWKNNLKMWENKKRAWKGTSRISVFSENQFSILEEKLKT